MKEKNQVVPDEVLSKEYLRTKMPDVGSSLKSKLISGEKINITTRIIVKTDIAQGKILFPFLTFK